MAHNLTSGEYRIERAHPWHGLSCTTENPDVLVAYIEVVPTDSVKYEIDKATGILKVDRPQKYSSSCPTLYGFLPQTYCGAAVAEHTSERVSRPVQGDHDPLDICVLNESLIMHGDILVSSIPIGGLRILDGDEADEKIVAVLAGDAAYGSFEDIDDLPPDLIARLEHYFLTYKQFPEDRPRTVKLQGIYGASEARQIIRLAQQDYRRQFAARPTMVS